MKTYQLIVAAGLLTLCFSISLWHSEVFSSIPETTAEVTAQSAVQPDTTGKYRLIQLASERGWVRIIVTWKMEGYQREGLLGQSQRLAQREEIQQLVQQRQEELEATNLNFRISRNMQLNPSTIMTVDEDALRYLYNSDRVEKIEENWAGTGFRTESTEIIQSDYVNTRFALTGVESIIVIIDDGVESQHEEFGWPNSPSRFIDGACFSTNDPNNGIESLCPAQADTSYGLISGLPCNDSEIDCSHGTFVAGIAAGESGVAPDAAIVSIQAFSKFTDNCPNDESSCKQFQIGDLISALELVWIRMTANSWTGNLAAVNMSLGLTNEFSEVCDDYNSTFTSIINDIYSLDATLVAASGNSNFSNGTAWPACIENVISVGATTKDDEHWVAHADTGSNAAPYLDLVAPGVDIISPVPGGFGGEYAQGTGTSGAAPHVAGTIALMRQANSNETFTNSDILTVLQNTADKVSGMGNNSFTKEYGHGRLNARVAVTEALIDNTFVDVIQSNVTIPNERNQFDPMYILEDVILTVNGTLNLYDNLYILGTLKGNGCIELFGDAAIIDTYGENEFPPENIGDCDADPDPVYPTVSDTTFTQNTVLADTLMLAGVTTLEPGVTVTVAENNLIIVADTLQMNGSVSSISTFASSGELRLSEGIYVNGGRLLAHSEGEIDIEEEAILQSTSLTIQSGGQAIIRDGASVNTGGGFVTVHSGAALQMHNNTTLNTAGGGVLVLSGAELQVHDNVSFLMDEGRLTISSATQIGSQFNFVNGFISIQSTSASLTIGSGASLSMAQMAVSMPEPRRTPSFVVRGNLHLLGG